MGNGKALGRLRGLIDNIPADWLRDLRGVASQTSVALKADISQPHLANLEAGHKPLTRATAAKLARVFGQTPDALLGAQVLAGLKEMSLKSPEELDPRLLVEVVQTLDSLLPQTEFKESLLTTLLELATERLGAYQEQRAAVATKSAARQEGTRDGLGFRRNKPYAPGGIR